MLLDYYLWFKALHIIAVISWMAAMLYLPRLFVYHSDTEIGSPQSETFKMMEWRLLRYIATPAMIVTWIMGITLIALNTEIMTEAWMHVKMAVVIFLSGFHGLCASWVKKFARDQNNKSRRFYKIVNEVPTIFMIIIVVMVIIRPF